MGNTQTTTTETETETRTSDSNVNMASDSNKNNSNNGYDDDDENIVVNNADDDDEKGRKKEKEKIVMPRMCNDEWKEKDKLVEVRKLDLPWVKRDYFAVVLPGFFSKELCKELIAKSEEFGYDGALINIGGGRQIRMTDVRNGDRAIIDDFQMAEDMLERLRPFLPKTFTFKSYRPNTQDDEMPISSVNERMRFLRYDKGGYFKPHYDGVFTRPGEISEVTIQMYLNEGFEGGTTRFLSSDEKQYVDVVPKIGDVLIFEHKLYHEGCDVKKGRKYTIRTDVMYAFPKES